MTEKQKEAKIKNLLNKMHKKNTITTDSDNKRKANWILVKK